MIVCKLARFRAIMLLLALGLSLAGQALAGIGIGDQMSSGPAAAASVVNPGAMQSCPDCNGGKATAPTRCPVAFCWNFVAIPALAVGVERGALPELVALPYSIYPGIALRPEPHPPRSINPA